MKLEISINIERLGPAEFEVKTVTTSDTATNTDTRTYQKTNGIFPMYNALIHTLRSYENISAVVKTNSPQFNDEISTLDGRQTKLATMLQDILALKNIQIEIAN